MKSSEKITAIMPDFVKAVEAIKAIKKDSENKFLKNKYASLDTIIEAVKPVLGKHNLAAVQTVSTEGIETIIMHISGEWLSSGALAIPSEQSKGLSIAQSFGVATTYAKRYQLGSMLGISTDEDTDGGSASKEQQQAPPAAKPTAKPAISDEMLMRAINKIIAGDKESETYLPNHFTMTKEQIELYESKTNKKWNQQ